MHTSVPQFPPCAVAVATMVRITLGKMAIREIDTNGGQSGKALPLSAVAADGVMFPTVDGLPSAAAGCKTTSLPQATADESSGTPTMPSRPCRQPAARRAPHGPCDITSTGYPPMTWLPVTMPEPRGRPQTHDRAAPGSRSSENPGP